MKRHAQVNEYIKRFPEEIQIILSEIRSIILHAAPDAEESFAYGMPAYKTFQKPLVYFAAFKNHIGLYATPSGHEAFKNELSHYKQGKGSVQFPLSEPIPLSLIQRIVAFRVDENKKAFGQRKKSN
jgi:uncharacterized protein YdhG (YjbR/CyaY superfamily)